MNCAAKIQVGDHPAEDTFVSLHNPQQDARTHAALDRHTKKPRKDKSWLGPMPRHTVVGNVVLGAGVKDKAITLQEWDSPLSECRMMNTGKPRETPSDGAIYSAVSREDERKRRAALAPVPQIGGLKIYLAGPMTGIAHFNFPTFYAAAKALRKHGHEVFNPAEHDVIRHGGIDISLDNETGDPTQSAAKHGFSLRDALRDDTHYICTTANAIAMLPGWENSKGARAEHALACALGHQILYLGGIYG